MDKEERPEVAWSPQEGPQASLVTCPVYEILYGGARGGGKTDGMLGKHGIKAEKYGAGVVGVFFRKTREDLKEAIERSQEIYGPIGAIYQDQKKQWIFPNGARLKFEYLARDKDANNYQGHNYTDLYFEELTHWATPDPINKLRATLRSPTGIPCQFHATANPGGPGHNWVKARYIDPAPAGWEIITEEYENPFNGETQTLERIFIPAKLSDNRLLIDNDPLYVAKLHQTGSEQLVKAWLNGDWDIIEGAFFDCWDARKHVIRPFAIPEEWPRFSSGDWGSAKPFSFGKWAVVTDDYAHESGILPRGAIVRYFEWYGMQKGKPNVGLKLTAEEVGQGLKSRKFDECKTGVIDPAAFAEDGGPSIASRISAAGKVYFRPADNKRVPQRGAMGGWDQMRARLKGVDGRPMLYTFSTCVDSIRTIPVLQHDPLRAEDLDTDGEDHAADEWRYACMSRPWTPPVETTQKRKSSYVANEPESDVRAYL